MVHQVLHILGSAQSQNTAFVRIVASLAAGLDPDRFRVHAWFLGEDGPLVAELQKAGVQVRALPWRTGRRKPTDVWRVWRALRGHRFAIVHHHVGGKLLSWLTRHFSGARIIVHVHGRVIEAESFAPREIHIRHADAAIATSREVAQWIRGVRPDVVYAGVETEAETSGSMALVPGRTGHTIGTACRLVPVKDLMTLLGALVRLRDDVPDARLEIAGDGPERSRLEREVAARSLTGAVTFLGWRADIRAVMSGWDVFALPSLEESFPIAALEAMTAGLPVVASAVGGLPELVIDGETGWLVPPGDPGALAERLRALLLNPELRRALGASGRNRARQHFSMEQMVAAITRIYDRVLQ
jgi:glycosyltransferase involved in cell wall biosynthesis